MRVCYFGTYDENFPRNKVLIQGLLENGVQVVRCQAKLWSGTQDKIDGVNGFRKNPLALSLFRRFAGSYWRLLREHRRAGPYDVMVVGYAGHLDIFLARVLTWLSRKPLAFDAFLSVHGTVVDDRRLVKPGSPVALGLWLADRVSCALADRVFLDTQAHIDWFCARYQIPEERFRRVLMGSEAFEPWERRRPAAGSPQKISVGGSGPQPDPLPQGEGETSNGSGPLAEALRGGGPRWPQSISVGSQFKVLYFGNYIPLHGVEHILGAARELRGHAGIVFELVGEGQTYEEARRLAQDNALSNVRFIHGWFPPVELAAMVKGADLCLGIFGTGRKADMVIPQKVAFSLALGRPVLTRDSLAIREVFTPGRDLMVCTAGSPQSLAAAILALARDASLRDSLALAGQSLYQEMLSPRAVGQAAKAHLVELCQAR